MLVLVLGLLGRKKKTEEDEESGEETEREIRKKKGWRILSLVPAIAAVIAFLLTEDMRLPTIFTGRWTLLMAIIALAQVVLVLLSKKRTQDPEDEDREAAMA